MSDDDRNSIERYLANRTHDRYYSYFDTLNQDTAQLGKSVTQALLLINGGAAVAILALAGTLASLPDSDLSSRGDEVTLPLRLFAWGVVASAAGLALAWVANMFGLTIEGKKELTWERPFVGEPKDAWLLGRLQLLFQFLCVLSVAAALLSFLWGILAAEAIIEIIL